MRQPDTRQLRDITNLWMVVGCWFLVLGSWFLVLAGVGGIGVVNASAG